MKLHKSIINFVFAAPLITIFGIIGVIAIISTTYAQIDSNDVAAKYGVTFPIAELGNCEDLYSCRTYCEDPVNQSACIEFAKNKGFYKEDSLATSKEEILAAAKGELGCDSYESCIAFCQDSSNFDRCDAFAKGHNLGGGHVANPEEQELLTKAKEVLGCDSPASCMNFCDSPSNRDKCSDFAKQVGIRGGHMEQGPGGCTSEATCREFCSNPQNYSICSTHSSSAGQSFQGPGGCNSEETCREYCSKNPKECGFEGTDGSYSYPIYNPAETCSKTPDCTWTNNTCECIGKINEGNGQTQSVPTGYSNQQYTYPTHTSDQNYQPPSGGGTYDPSSECSKTPGCSWNGSTCQCSTQSSGTQESTQTTTETQTQTSQPQNYTPPSDSGTYTQPSDSGSYTAPSSGVQGAKAASGVLNMLLDFLGNLLNRE